MDEALLDNINTLIAPNDTLYHVGDFAFARGVDEKSQIKTYRDRINCKTVFLIAGNHDPHDSLDQPRPWLREIFSNVYVRIRLKTTLNGERQNIVMDHYSGRVWNSSHHGVWQFFGHSHYSLPDDPNSLSIDVGIDAVAGRATGKTHKQLSNENAWNLLDIKQYRPISLTEIASIMSTKEFASIDHHK